MKSFAATLLATALAAAFSSAYAADTKADTATYRNLTQKAAADYKVAAAKCTGMSGNERSLCAEEAKVARARVDVDTVAQYNNTLKARRTARTALANAEHALGRAKCATTTGADKDTCTKTAHSVHTAALADAKADRDVRVAATGSTDPVKAAAVDKCAQVAGGNKDTACLVDNKNRVIASTAAGTAANRTDNAAANTAANTRAAGTTLGQKTENLAETVVQKTKNAAAIVADKTGRAVDRIADRTDRTTDQSAAKTDRAGERMADKTDRAGERMADKTSNAAARTGKVVADTVITTKVKADLFKEPELSAMAIHVETEKGVVMLSGFVDSKSDAEKAVRLAKSVEGVTQVKSAIKVK